MPLDAQHIHLLAQLLALPLDEAFLAPVKSSCPSEGDEKHLPGGLTSHRQMWERWNVQGGALNRHAPETLRHLFDIIWGGCTPNPDLDNDAPIRFPNRYYALAHEILLHDQGRFRLRGFRLGTDVHLDSADTLFLWHQFTLISGASLLPALHQSRVNPNHPPPMVDPVGDDLHAILAENTLVECHVHAGSAFLVEEIWLDLLGKAQTSILNGKPLPWVSEKTKYNTPEELPRLTRRMLQAVLLRYALEYRLCHQFTPWDREEEVLKLAICWSEPKREATPLSDRERFDYLERLEELRNHFILWGGQEHPFPEESLFLTRCLHRLDTQEEVPTAICPGEWDLHQLFWHYARLKAWLLREHIQSPRREGFTYFREDYYIALRRLGDAQWFSTPDEQLTRWRTQLSPFKRLQGMELRCAPNNTDDVKNMLAMAAKSHERHRQGDGTPMLGVIVHFTKPDDPKDSENHVKEFTKLRVMLDNLKVMLKTSASENLPRHLVGLDVANVEINAPNWLFLPIFLEFRPWWRRELADFPTPGYTFHAGEEYLTLSQGLRHMDEVVSFFPWEANDRLGHGLALGDHPGPWLRRHQLVPVPLEQLLFDRIWEYRMHAERGIDLPWHQRRDLEREIQALGRDLFPADPVLDADQWLLFYKGLYCPQAVMDALGNPVSWDWIHGHETETAAQLRRDANVHQIFRRYLTSRSSLLKTHRHWRPLFPMAEEARRFEAFQEEMLARFSRKRLAIECCPSSNVMIRDMTRYRDHPLIRIRKKIPVMLNTDNPAIFGTHLDMELALLYHALAQPGEHDNHPEGYPLAEREEIIREFIRNNHAYTFIHPIREEIKRQRLLHGH